MIREVFNGALSPADAALVLIASHATVAGFAFALGGGYGFARALRHRLARRLGETLQEARGGTIGRPQEARSAARATVRPE